MDVKITFLNDKIDEEVYINWPKVFEVHGRDTHICKLKKAMYRLKKEPFVYYSRID
jgi:hypothetical protein